MHHFMVNINKNDKNARTNILFTPTNVIYYKLNTYTPSVIILAEKWLHKTMT